MKALKAILGGLASALGTLYLAFDGDNLVTQAEWVNVALLGLTTFNVIYFAVNKDDSSLPDLPAPKVVVVAAPVPASKPDNSPVDVND